MAVGEVPGVNARVDLTSKLKALFKLSDVAVRSAEQLVLAKDTPSTTPGPGSHS